MFVLGVALLLIGVALVFVARQRADGTSILPLGDGMMIYPVTCLAFIAFGIAFTLFGL
jgi:hypothetical protein